MDPTTVIIVAIVFTSVTIMSVTKAGISYLQSRQRAEGAAGSGLAASELKRMIREAVEDGIAPLHHRLDAIERRLPVAAPALERSAPSPALPEAAPVTPVLPS